MIATVDFINLPYLPSTTEITLLGIGTKYKKMKSNVILKGNLGRLSKYPLINVVYIVLPINISRNVSS